VRPRLFKAEGAGNDFLLGIGAWADRLAHDSTFVRRICDRRLGIGADGVIALFTTARGRVRLNYRNADGGEAPFCANATRCAARAAVEHLDHPSHLVVDTGWGSIPAEVEGPEVTLELPPPSTPPVRSAIDSFGSLGDFQLLEVGVPHLAVATQSLADLDLGAVAPSLRSHPAVGPNGANVNFYEIDADGVVQVRSWERGVEGETLCCGSGLVAVALLVMAAHDLRRVVLVPASGDRLTVEALGEPPSCPTRFTGPTRFIAEIEPSDELLRAH
jgi:diaminopimelate epimerase